MQLEWVFAHQIASLCFPLGKKPMFCCGFFFLLLVIISSNGFWICSCNKRSLKKTQAKKGEGEGVEKKGEREREKLLNERRHWNIIIILPHGCRSMTLSHSRYYLKQREKDLYFICFSCMRVICQINKVPTICIGRR